MTPGSPTATEIHHVHPTPPLDREAERRLAIIRHVEEVTGNVALTCRYCAVSWQAYYIWYRPFQAEGVDGLRTRSKRSKTSPQATRAEVIGKILYLRQHYHFGPEKIPAQHFQPNPDAPAVSRHRDLDRITTWAGENRGRWERSTNPARYRPTH